MSFARQAASWIPSGWRHGLTRRLWQQLNFRIEGDQGLKLEMEGSTDWSTLNEVLVQGEYDGAVLQAIESANLNRGMIVMDLGANIGFFELRLAALARAKSIPLASIQVIAVEPATTTFGRLKNAISAWPNIKAIHALVGKRQGSERIFTSSGNASASTHGSGNQSEMIPYIDLLTLCPTLTPIDLIKCDIEGSEQEFLENYRELLSRTRWLVIEFHHALCDVPRCQAILEELQYTQQSLIKDVTLDTGRFSTVLYRGPAAAFN